MIKTFRIWVSMQSVFIWLCVLRGVLIVFGASTAKILRWVYQRFLTQHDSSRRILASVIKLETIVESGLSIIQEVKEYRKNENSR